MSVAILRTLMIVQSSGAGVAALSLHHHNHLLPPTTTTTAVTTITAVAAATTASIQLTPRPQRLQVHKKLYLLESVKRSRHNLRKARPPMGQQIEGA